LAYWFLAGIAVSLALASIIGEGKRARWILERLPAPIPSRLPAASVIVPVKGLDEGLAANLVSLAALDYPDFELIIAARRQEDIPAGVVPADARVVIAGEGDSANGEKINNLLAAVTAARPESEVLAFADSDGHVPKDWLRALVAALEEPGAGAASGYRWHVPSSPGFWSLLRSVWNAVIAGAFSPSGARFAWGGAMAIRRADFTAFRVPVFWHGAISDDYRLSEAVRRAGRRIAYAPAALVASEDHATAREFFTWTRRQMMITRFYSPGLWFMALAAHLIYCAAMLASLTLALGGYWPAAVALVLQLGAGMIKGRNRLAIARAALPQQAESLRQHGWVHVWLTPLATWAWLVSIVASTFGRTVHWRGRVYRLSR
jgi:cellulose synthase/poly-beta-1,6-N-acetylglucosamine synthase-like glycosyltransferase